MKNPGGGNAEAIEPPAEQVACDFAALWRDDGFRAAGEAFWADDVVSIEPHPETGATGSVCRGIKAVRAKNLHWMATHGVEDLSLDGPFVTGDRFALFADMVIAHAGKHVPHSKIAVFKVRNGQIIEERFFYE